MKYFYTCMVLLALIVVGTYYYSSQNADLPEQVIENIAVQKAPVPSDSSVPQEPQKYINASYIDKESIVEQLQDSVKLEEIILTEEQQEAYALYSEIYNGILDFDSESNNIDEKYRLLPHEVDFVIDNDINYIMSIVIEDIDNDSFPDIDINGQKMNVSNLQALSMALTIKGLEREVQYYFPDYSLGGDFPRKKDYGSSNDFPTTVRKYINDIVLLSFVSFIDDPRIHLSRANFFEINAAHYGPSGHPQIVELYAKAQRTLKSNTLRDYVATKYPEHFESFLEQSAQTGTE
jgi:hypothetical protein